MQDKLRSSVKEVSYHKAAPSVYCGNKLPLHHLFLHTSDFEDYHSENN